MYSPLKIQHNGLVKISACMIFFVKMIVMAGFNLPFRTLNSLKAFIQFYLQKLSDNQIS